MRRVIVYILVVYVGCVMSTTQLLKNRDFENRSFDKYWNCAGCSLSPNNDAVSKSTSAQVTNRKAFWSGIQQTLSLQAGKRYVFKGYIKLLNLAYGTQNERVVISMNTVDGNGNTRYNFAADMKYTQVDYGWTEMGFDFTLPSDTTGSTLRIRTDHRVVNFLVDNLSLKELPDITDWKTKANTNIENIRKGKLRISYAGGCLMLLVEQPKPDRYTMRDQTKIRTYFGWNVKQRSSVQRVRNKSGIDNSELSVELQQVKSKFVFGSAVKADLIVDRDHTDYQKFFYDNFEWAVLANALKWKPMEKQQGQVDYDKPLKAINSLLANGIKIRGHNMFWAVDKHVPTFLDAMTSEEVLTAMKTRVDNLIARTKGKLEHWDVNNEKLHGDYFSRKTGNVNITQDMFKWINQNDPDVKLFLNEYNALNNHLSTTAYLNQAKRMVEAGVPIYGVGVQSHFSTSDLDITAMKYRLDKLAEAGLPLWITEITIAEVDENKKAEALDDALTLYFSHPAVDGLILWNYWEDAIFEPTAALAIGPNVTANKAGERYHEMYKQRWRTNKVLPFQTQTIRGFKGEYALHVMHNNMRIHSQNFYLDNRKTVNVRI